MATESASPSSSTGKTTWTVPGFVIRKLRNAPALEWMALRKSYHAQDDNVHARMTKSALVVFRAAIYYTDLMANKNFSAWIAEDLGIATGLVTSVVEKLVGGRLTFLEKNGSAQDSPDFMTTEEVHLCTVVDTYIRNYEQRHRYIDMSNSRIKRIRRIWRDAFEARPDAVLDGRLPPPRARSVARRQSASPVDILAAFSGHNLIADNNTDATEEHDAVSLNDHEASVDYHDHSHDYDTEDRVQIHDDDDDDDESIDTQVVDYTQLRTHIHHNHRATIDYLEQLRDSPGISTKERAACETALMAADILSRVLNTA